MYRTMTKSTSGVVAGLMVMTNRRAPVAGEHLIVPDPLPDPALGDARYYLAAVNHQGQRRAGRTSMSGVLQGRNAGGLQACP